MQVIFFPRAALAILSDSVIAVLFILGSQDACFPDQGGSDILRLAWLHHSHLSLSMTRAEGFYGNWMKERVGSQQSDTHAMSSLMHLTMCVETQARNSDVQRPLLLGFNICPTWSADPWQQFAAAQKRWSMVLFLCKGPNCSGKGW